MNNLEANEQHQISHYRNPLVSVVVPTYNGEKYIEECIESIQSQDYAPLEIIVVDDASTDNTPCLAGHYDVLFTRNRMNMGECYTSSFGFSCASGTYIARQSQDDAYIDPSHLLNQVKAMERTGADFCYNSKTLVGSDISSAHLMETKWLLTSKLDNVILSCPLAAFEIWKRRNPISSSSLMFRASSFHKLHYPTSYRTTWDAVMEGRALKAGMKCVALNGVGTFYRIHPEQTTNNPLYWEELKSIRKGIV